MKRNAQRPASSRNVSYCAAIASSDASAMPAALAIWPTASIRRSTWRSVSARKSSFLPSKFE